MRPNSLTKNANSIRYVVTEDSDIKRSSHWDHWRWLLVLMVLGGAGAFGYFGITYFNEEAAEIVEMEAEGLAANISPESLSCTDYKEKVEDCTEVSIDNINNNGCGYYYELKTISAPSVQYYASACSYLAGTDSCERNDDCSEEMELTDLDISPVILSCTEIEEEVDDCKGISIDDIKVNGCGHYYELKTIKGSNYASACYSVAKTDACARNDECAEEMEVTNLQISTASISCTEYEEEVDDCTDVSIDEIKDNGCGYYYEEVTIDDVDYASACYCVVGTDSCARDDDCLEEL